MTSCASRTTITGRENYLARQRAFRQSILRRLLNVSMYALSVGFLASKNRA